MKKIYLLPFLAFLESCTVSNYYQVYKTHADTGAISNNKIVFEDNNCSVGYDFWSSGGDVSFTLFNKTDNDLTVDMTKSFFVLNGVSYEYYQNRTFSKSSSSGNILSSYSYSYYWYWYPVQVAGTSSTNFSISFAEKPFVTIPPKTLVYISEYHISNGRYMNCNLTSYPRHNNVKTMNFDESNSPFVFSNLITYRTKNDSIRMSNKFYVSEVTNMPESDVMTEVSKDECGRKYQYPQKVFMKGEPDKFYVLYTMEK